jgi:methylenetetrahydrofolate dehydrogenase (NADP+) / methenyltetrahydrofolate cyclohydrolase
MSAILLDGKTLAASIRQEVKNEIAAAGLKPGLAVILIGDDPASHLYVALKEKAATEVGIAVNRFDYPAETGERTVIAKIRELNNDPKINAILIQLPLPAAMNPNAVIAEIDPAKDVDGFHPKNTTGILSPGIAGPLELLKKTGVELKNRHAVVVGNSAVFTQSFCDPLRVMQVRAEPTYPENTGLMREADILVVAVGRPGFVKPDMVKPGAIVIDIGTNKVEGKTVGDVAPEVAEKASFMTPVPGGVGPMTVAMLLKNTVELCKQQGKVNSG